MDDSRALLQEWFDWWSASDIAPAKLPDGLHVRTALALFSWTEYAFTCKLCQHSEAWSAQDASVAASQRHLSTKHGIETEFPTPEDLGRRFDESERQS